ncbi:MAG: Hsp20/alpha crystallin family protein [Candidatus Hodarchaeota archaeon]
MSDDYDEYDDFFEIIKKYLGINTDMFDVDFLFLPEIGSDPQSKEGAGFKVTYHFEAGMDRPEVRIEGDFDEKKLQDYFERINYSNYPNFKVISQKINKKEIDVKELQLDSVDNKSKAIEPFTEIIECTDHIKIIIEAPGVDKSQLLLSLSEDGRSLRINAKSQFRKFLKTIHLPFKCSLDNYNLEIKNGIITLKLNKLIIKRG